MHGVFYKLATDLENSGNLKNCQNRQNHREISGRKFEFMWVKLENSWRRQKINVWYVYIYIRYIPADFSLLSCSGKSF